MNSVHNETPLSQIELPVFIQWMDFLKWLFLATDKFPKKARFTFSERINQLALNIVEDLIEAKYTKSKSIPLKRANLALEKLRVLLRICYEIRILPHQSYKHAIYSLNEVGKMMGGWTKYQEKKE